MLMPVYAVFMRLLYLDVEKGSRTSVCTSTMKLESLSGEFWSKVIGYARTCTFGTWLPPSAEITVQSQFLGR